MRKSLANFFLNLGSKMFAAGKAIPKNPNGLPPESELSSNILGPRVEGAYGQYGFQFRADIDQIIAKRGKGRKSFYWDMIDSDPDLAGLTDTRIDNVAALDREIIPASEDPADMELAKFVADALDELNDFDISLQTILSACITGTSFTEIIWKESEWDGLPVLVPQSLKDRPVDLFYLWTEKEKGRRWYFSKNLELISSSLQISGEPLEKYPYKFITHTFRDRGSSLSGVSLLRSVYWIWFFKHEGFGNWMKASEVGAEVTPVIYYPPDSSPDEIAELVIVAKKLLKAKYAVLQEGNKIEFPNITIDPDFASNLIRTCDIAMRYRVLGSTLSSGTDQGGNKALGEVHADKEQDRKESDAKALMATLNTTLIRWIVDLNFETPQKYPRIKFNYETADDVKEVRENIKMGNELGIPMKKTYVAKKLQIEMAPPDTPEEELVEKPAPPPLPSPTGEEEPFGGEKLIFPYPQKKKG